MSRSMFAFGCHDKGDLQNVRLYIGLKDPFSRSTNSKQVDPVR